MRHVVEGLSEYRKDCEAFLSEVGLVPLSPGYEYIHGAFLSKNPPRVVGVLLAAHHAAVDIRRKEVILQARAIMTSYLAIKALGKEHNEQEMSIETWKEIRGILIRLSQPGQHVAPQCAAIFEAIGQRECSYCVREESDEEKKARRIMIEGYEKYLRK